MCGAGAYHTSPPFVDNPSWGCASVPHRSHELVSKGVLCARTGHKSTGIRGVRGTRGFLRCTDLLWQTVVAL